MKFLCIKTETIRKIEKYTGITARKTYIGQIVPSAIWGNSTSTYSNDWNSVVIMNDNKKWKDYPLEIFEAVE